MCVGMHLCVCKGGQGRWIAKVVNSDHRMSTHLLIRNFYTVSPSFRVFSLYTKLWLRRR